MRNGKAGGFSYIGVMIFIAIAGVALAGIGSLASIRLQREKEAQLLFVGDQFRLAIESYYQGTPIGNKQYPATLHELLEDKRFPQPRRHLRQIYHDPMTGSQEWGLVDAGGRITGVYSLSEAAPRKKGNFPPGYEEFEKAASYRDWKFIAAATPGAGNGVAVPANTGFQPDASAAAAPTAAASSPLAPGPAANTLAAPPPAAKEPATGDCQGQLASDLALCGGTCAQTQSTDCNRCRSSALVRNAACRSGAPMPPLVTP